MKGRGTRRIIRAAGCVLILGALLPAVVSPALGGPRDQAKRLHDRLAGVPPDAQTLDTMESLVQAGDPIGAAFEAMRSPTFYTTVLKNFATPWTNVERTVFAELNDYTATVIGMVRDDVPFDQILSADLVYVGAPGVVATPYSPTDNDHYRELERARADLGDPQVLIGVSQSALPGSQLGASDTAGVITTRAAGEAFFSAGTNRRMLRFMALDFLCRDLEDLKDVTRPVDRIRQDVSRSPGGDSSIFHNHCSGCHTGMDPLAGAFAYYEWDSGQERVVYTPGQVQGKYLINAETFPFGYVTTDDRWDNYWRQGVNAGLGWGATAGGGFGAKGLGQEVAGSRAFAVCQVEKVFQQVCFRPAGSQEDRDAIEAIADAFEQTYSMKQVFAETAVHCMGQ